MPRPSSVLGTTKLSTQVFNAGPAEVEALFGGSLDAGFIGPSPAINAFVQSHGDYVIIAGAMSGGAALIVNSSISSPDQLKGKNIATPQLGNTQDIALRAYLASKGYKVSTTGGDVNIIPQDNATTVTAFKAGKIDGAWVPEPFASRLILEGGGHELVNEKSLWSDGKFTTTVLIAKKSYVNDHPQTIKALIAAELQAIDYINSDKAGAETAVNAQLTTLSGKPLTQDVIDRAFGQITPTVDPIASSLKTEQDHAVAAGTVKEADLKGIFDLAVLNELLKAQSKASVDTAGL
jgi:NitT/TauT family transport system substrate-binding protein